MDLFTQTMNNKHKLIVTNYIDTKTHNLIYGIHAKYKKKVGKETKWENGCKENQKLMP